MRLTGSWTEHPRFGRQFDCRTWEALKPTGEAAIVKMLGSGAIKGVGPAMAQRIVDCFGEDTFRIIDEHPERLREVPGIGKKKAEDIISSYSEMTDTRELVFSLKVTVSAATMRPVSNPCMGQRRLRGLPIILIVLPKM